MAGKVKTERKLYTVTKICIWLGVLMLGAIAIGLSLYYDNGSWLEVSVGLFSGAAISFVTSFTITQQDTKTDQDQHEKMLALLNTLGKELQNESTPNGIRVYKNNRNDGLDMNAMLGAAKKRIWILGTDLSNTLVRCGDQIVEACRNNPDMDLRIMALHPQSLFMNTRHGEIGWDHSSEMRQSVYEAQQNLAELKQKIRQAGCDAQVQIRLYLSQPTVILYILDNTLVISHLVIGSRASDALQLCCDMEVCKDLGQDFVEKHFESVWNTAIPLEKAKCYWDKESNYSISLEGQITEYTFSRRGKWLRGICNTVCGAGRKIRDFFRDHAVSLSVPMLSMLVAGVFLYLTQTDGMIQISPDFKLNGYYTNTALGLVAGSILTIIEYCLENWFEGMNEKRREDQIAQESETIRQCLNDVFFRQKENQYGISICENRNAADFKGRILNAKKRVWIFATNHRYISSLDVHRFLKEKSGEIDVRFLMLSPQSMFVATRYSEIPGKQSPADFAIEISNNLMHLINEYKDEPRVGLRLYHRQPTFMMYLIDDTLILSHILRQGRARDQAHFLFDLNYPRIRMIVNDYINHFQEVWEEAVKCNRKNAAFHTPSRWVTVKQGIKTDVKIGVTADGEEFVKQEEMAAV